MERTDILEVIDSLEHFVTEAKIGIKGTAFASQWKAINSRELTDDMVFIRCLHTEMTSTLGFKRGKDTNVLILATLSCIFTEEKYADKHSTNGCAALLEERRNWIKNLPVSPRDNQCTDMLSS